MQHDKHSHRWGLVSIVFHWVSAVVIIAMLALGLWMVELDYYSDWYRIAPDWHRSVGFLLIFFIVLRLLWRSYNGSPVPIESHQRWEKQLSKVIHYTLYMLLILMLPTGYFITTAQGQSLDVFNWFSIPAIFTDIERLEDLAGVIHEWLAYSIIALAIVHIAGALKHHFIDRDNTLQRMLGR